MHPALRIALCAASGVLMFLSCASFDIWPLAWFALVPLLIVILDVKRNLVAPTRLDSPFFLGWVTGLLANGGGFYWINSLLQRFGHMPFIASAPIYALLIGYQALPYGIFAWALSGLRGGTKLPVALLAPVTMTALELCVPFIFPWYYAITQAWVRPVIQIADLTGPLGVTFLLVLWNGALYQTIAPLLRREKAPRRPLLFALATIALALVYGQIRIAQVDARRAAAPKMKVGVVQANVGIDEKFVPEKGRAQLALHQRLSASLADRGADLIVWPESSYPFAIARDQPGDFPDSDGRKVMRGFHKPLLFGALTIGRDSPYPFNTALLLDESGSFRGRFDKNFLLVFGEYVPFYEQLKWFRELVPEASNFARGQTVTTFPVERGGGAGTVRVGPMICYEDIIPSFARRLVAERPAPNFFVNITNDAWFGDTSEPWEHLQLAVFRAVENRLDLVRAVNTGVSAFVDATGRVYDKGPAVDPLITPGVQPITLLDEVAILDATGLYGRIGDVFGALNLVALLGLAAWARKRAGAPIAWGMVLVATGLFALAILVAALAAAGPGSFFAALGLYAHRATSGAEAAALDPAASFALGARLVAAAGLAFIAAGYGLGRFASGTSPRLEVAVAAVETVLVPAVFFGRIEGETASLVFTSAGAVGLALLGLRLATRRRARLAAPAAPAIPPAPKAPGSSRRAR